MEPIRIMSALDWELEKQWERNRQADAHNWTPEAFAMRWYSGGVSDWEGWNQLPEYQRRAWLRRYETHKFQAETISWYRMPSPKLALEMEEELYQIDKKLAESWAQELRQAFKERRPCPIRPAPEYKWFLDWAYEIAQLDQGNFVNEEEFNADAENGTKGKNRPKGKNSIASQGRIQALQGLHGQEDASPDSEQEKNA